mmetsp:Transcript_36158/g.88996  ORF Transcript_36158/g.88996 Transcript_36158/m.88996 type:complete len:520 (+) Transcript_36158:188-1747(+)
MVVLSACLTSKAGKPLVSRQFVEMSRIRIEGLLAAFPKLINTGKQHTYVETESVRYVYQPMESLYLLLITNKSSNIMEDLETLRLLAKLVPEFCPELDEEGVREQAFDLILAFDEVLAMGHRENLNLQQVKTALEMESHEEKLHQMIRQSKINEAKEEAKRKAVSIDQSKAQRAKAGLSGTGTGISGGPGGGGGFLDDDRKAVSRVTDFEPEPEQQRARPKAPTKGKGMQLGSKTKQSQDVLRAMQAEDELMGMVEPAAAAPARGSGPAAKKSGPMSGGGGDGVNLKAEERLLVRMSKDGNIEAAEIKGELKMLIGDAESSYTRVQVETSGDKSIQFKTHPNINRGLWAEENVLSHRDQSKNFPVGNELGILKWRIPAPSTLPLTVSCWPSAVGKNATVNLEYESESPLTITDVYVSVPCGAQPNITDVAEGDARFNGKKGMVEWKVDLIDDSNRNGSMEFTVPDSDLDSFFPISVTFMAEGCMSGIKVLAVTDNRTSKPLAFNASQSLEVEDYEIGNE